MPTVEEEQQEEPSVAETPKSGGRLWLWIVIAVVVIGAAVGGLLLLRSRRHSAPAAPPTEPPVQTVLHLEPFVVNLSSGGYLRIGIELGIAGGEKGEKGKSAEPVQRVALVRDIIVSVLTQSRADDLLSPEGKQKLKTDLIGRLGQAMPELHAREVYFTEFLVQP